MTLLPEGIDGLGSEPPELALATTAVVAIATTATPAAAVQNHHRVVIGLSPSFVPGAGAFAKTAAFVGGVALVVVGGGGDVVGPRLASASVASSGRASGVIGATTDDRVTLAASSS